jgi:hypothetical protein
MCNQVVLADRQDVSAQYLIPSLKMLFETKDLIDRDDAGLDMFDYGAFDLIGERFQGLTVIDQDFLQNRYKLKCCCGYTLWKTADEINENRLSYCGSCPVPIKPVGRIGRERILGILRGAITRCHNPNSRPYKYYGARGITVSQEWRDDPEIFYRWARANGYDDDLTLDRKDNYSGYGPSNCRWITNAEQQRNKRRDQDRREGRVH